MDGIKAHLISIIAAAMICGIVIRIVGDKSANGKIVKMITGLFLLFSFIAPLKAIKIPHLPDYYEEFSSEARKAADFGQSKAKDAVKEGITKQVQAYITDRAEALNAQIAVEVTVSKDDIPLPIAVRLRGSISPYAKSLLSNQIANELGIDKEHQVWT